MRQWLGILGLIALTLVGCTSAYTIHPPATTKPIDIISTTTQNLLPIATHNISGVITQTPALPAHCPVENPELEFDLAVIQKAVRDGTAIDQIILDYLDKGGRPTTLVNIYNPSNSEKQFSFSGDLTGDGVAELVMPGHGESFVFGCKNSKYELLLDIKAPDVSTPEIVAVQDMNTDGIPEMVIATRSCISFSCLSVRIFEWNEKGFQSLVSVTYTNPNNGETQIHDFASMPGISKTGESRIIVSDVDGNGTQELLLIGGLPIGNDDIQNGPWREVTVTYMWNGRNFVFDREQYDSP